MELHGPDEPVYTIGVVARLLNIGPQTLRQFEREGLIEPSRTENNMRLYSQNELVALQRICQLIKVEGVNIAGVRAVLRVERRYGVVTTDFHAIFSVDRVPRSTAADGSAKDAAAGDQPSDAAEQQDQPDRERASREDLPRSSWSGGHTGTNALGLAIALALGLGLRWV